MVLCVFPPTNPARISERAVSPAVWVIFAVQPAFCGRIQRARDVQEGYAASMLLRLYYSFLACSVCLVYAALSDERLAVVAS